MTKSTAISAQEAPVRLVYKLTLSVTDPEGTIGYVAGKKAIVADLGGELGKVAIALCNESAKAEYYCGTLFNYQAATSLLKGDGWRLPTKEQCEELTKNKSRIKFEKSGVRITLGSNSVFFPYGGWMEGGSYKEQTSAVYLWTSTVGSLDTEHHYSVHFDQPRSEIYITDHYDDCCQNVRLFYTL